MQPYTKQFFQGISEGSRRSAEEIVPLVLSLIRPRNVIDVGCGDGSWLSVFREHGIADVVGVDGDYVDRSKLRIPEDRYVPFDVRKPFRMDRQFGLVVSLEVAEHLPEECASIFVDSLTSLGPVILFSAAIPFQGGTDHVNEQWPDYWVIRFQERGYAPIDCIRKHIWQNEHVEWWYAQNILMFARRDYLDNEAELRRELENTTVSQLSIVHPKKYVEELRFLRGLYLTTQDISSLIPPTESFILVDEDQFGLLLSSGRRTILFSEREGQYWGPPPDDEVAIRELERLRQVGAGFIVFAWPAFWWFDYYSEFHRHLRSRFQCVLEHDRLVVFDLRSNR